MSGRMSGRSWIIGAVVLGMALAWLASGRLGYPVAADEAGSLPAAPMQAQAQPEPGSVPAMPAEKMSPHEAAFSWPAGATYKLSDTSVLAFKSSLAALWNWQGDEGTYGDGQTRVKVVAQDGRVAGVEIIHNATVVSDDCLEAQLLYGVSVDDAGVATSCAGMWTREWAEAQGAQNTQGH